MRQTCGDLRRFPTRILWFSNFSPLCSPLPAFSIKPEQNKTKPKNDFQEAFFEKTFLLF